MKTIIKYFAVLFLTILAFNTLQYRDTTSLIAGFLFLLAALICVPPILDFFQKKTNIALPKSIKYIAVVSLFLNGLIILSQSEEFTKSSNETSLRKVKEEAIEDSIKIEHELIDKIASDKKSREEKEEADNTITQNPDSPNVGENGVINILAVGAVNKEAFSEIVTLANARDELGLENLIQSGYAIPLDVNTKVKVIESGWGKQRIRILSGKYRGQSVWVSPVAISKL